MNPHFWKNKRVFVTGHTGFKGSWLSLWLQSMGAEVTGFSLAPPTDPSLFVLGRVSEGMRSIEGDIRHADLLLNAVREAQPEIVLHLAAQPLVRYSYQHPVETYATNVMGTVHLLEAVRCVGGVKAVVNVTTDKCYENREWVWGYRENEPMGGYDPYSNSKGCSELVTAAFRNSFFNAAEHARHGTAIATARAGNVIGGGDWAQDRLVPDILAAFEGCKPVEIRYPGAIRPWQHVLEPLRGYLSLAERLFTQGPAFAEAWNFGPNDDDARPVGWIVDAIARRWGPDARWVHDAKDHPHEATYLKLDISKARQRLHWHPALRLEVALDYIVAWAKLHRQGADMRAVTWQQIHDYQSLTTH